MRRRWDLLRWIVFDAAANGNVRDACPDSSLECSREEWVNHIQLATDAGFIEWHGGTSYNLTSLGLDFHDAAYDDAVWREAEGLIYRKLGGRAPFDVVMWTLAEVSKRRLKESIEKPWT